MQSEWLSQKTYNHHGGSKVLPAQEPEHSRSSSSHLFNTITKSVSSKEPSNGNGLEETDPEQGHSRCRVKIHQLEDVDSTLKETM